MRDRQYVAVKAREAHETLLRQGWHRDSFVSNYTSYMTSPLCLMGAIKYVTSGRPWTSTKGTRLLMLAVAKHVPDGRLIDDWNDDPDTQFEDVCAVLQAVIQETESD